MNITVPENLGGTLRVLPEDTYQAQVQDCYIGTSKAGNPKLTVKWLITSEYSGKHGKDYKPTSGENVLEMFSLLPQAMWNLNDLYMETTGERIPQDDYSPESFLQMIKDALVGVDYMLDIVTSTESGEERSVVINRQKA